MVIKNWAYTHNFKDMLELVSQCGGDKVKTHLLYGPKNALYTSPEYIEKFIAVINDYINLPPLASLKSNFFTF